MTTATGTDNILYLLWRQSEHPAEATYDALVTEGNDGVAKMIDAMRSFIGANQMMAYLVMMAVRLVELQRVLTPCRGSHRHPRLTAAL